MPTPPTEPEPRTPAAGVPVTSGPLRWLLLTLGSLLAGLAALGAFLPVLPTTPFLLLAGACFARSSPRFHARLKRAPLFGVYVEQWERDRSIPARAKHKAYGLIVVAFGASVWAVDLTWLRVLLLIIALALVAFLAKLPTTRVGDPSARAADQESPPGPA